MDINGLNDGRKSSPPPSYSDIFATQPRSIEEPDLMIPFHGEYLTFERAKAVIDDEEYMGPPHTGLIQFSEKWNEAGGGNFRALYRRVNTKLDEFDILLYRQFKLPPQKFSGDVDHALAVCTKQDALEYAFHALDVPICHHIRLNMPEVATVVCRGAHLAKMADDSDNHRTFRRIMTPKCDVSSQKAHKHDDVFTLGTGIWRHRLKCTACDLRGTDTTLALRSLVDVFEGRTPACVVWCSLEVTVVLGTLRSTMDPAWWLHAFSQDVCRKAMHSWELWCKSFEQGKDSAFDQIGWRTVDGVLKRKDDQHYPDESYRCTVQ